jgi:glutaredoxin
MTTAQLYCQGGCAACSALARSLTDAGVALVTHEVAAGPAACDTVIALGYRSLPVLVAPDGTSAAGAAAGELARSVSGASSVVSDGHAHHIGGRDGDSDLPSGAATPALHPDLAVLAPLLGEWSGPGHGSYPSIEDFDYIETLHLGHAGKPFLTYAQRTVHASDGRALHVETGYLRPAGAGRVELVVSQPTGIVEVHEGSLDMTGDTLEIRLGSRFVGLTSSAKEVTYVERALGLDRDVLHTTLAMAAVGNPLTHHLASELRREIPKSMTEEVRR